MSYIHLSFTPVEEVVDVVGVLERQGFPIKGPRQRYYVLHEGTVGHLFDTQATSKVLFGVPTTELMMWFFDHHESCVACTVSIDDAAGRIAVRLNLEGAADDDVLAAARAVSALIEFLVDPEVEATVPIGLPQ
jgi:hypothetical protein